MATGYIEQLPSGSFRVSVYAGKDPITGNKSHPRETCGSQVSAPEAQARLLEQVEAETHPDR
ncbi:hypothetical protein GCM10022223_58630 [Kineosporia mesophila]|uniref:Uncharacterized protein n=1 Tax=Kineosporia mesophila TaxID=566012 RepID=A0ABP7AHX0_9ACTN|nr:hypothetical protein [Kineosporia mesophila]MCD5350778.1 hypothetical protein [Kineosporia mesophila]